MVAGQSHIDLAELKEALAKDAIWGDPNQPTKELTVFVHGYARGPLDYQGLLELFKEKSDVYAFNYDSSPFCSEDPHTIAASLSRSIAGRAAAYERLHLCGHSQGCLLLREAILQSVESPTETPLKVKLQQSDPQGVRVTLLAGTNRGYVPQGLTGAAIEYIHRWWWLVLLSIVACGGIVRIIARGGHRWRDGAPASGALWIAKYPPLEWILLGALVVGVLFAIRAFRKNQIRSWRLEILFWLPVVWGFWGAAGPILPASIANAASVAAVIWALAATLSMSKLLGFQCDAVAAQTVLVTGLSAALVCFVPPQIQWMWPAMIGLMLPLLVYPIQTGLLVEHVLYGSPWITGIRLRWLATFGALESISAPPIVHLYGEEDSLVSDDDHLELAHRGEYWQVALKGVKHAHFQLTARTDPDGQPRQADLNSYVTPTEALTSIAGDGWRSWLTSLVPTEAGKPDTAQSVQTKPDASRFRLVSAPQAVTPTDRSATQDTHTFPKGSPAPTAERKPCVIFLIHGIRDFGEWQEPLAAKIRSSAPDGIEVRDVVAVRYGYFSAFQFLFSGERLRTTRAFLDLYAQTKARHPDAECHVAAHSNGTYVIGTALLNNEFVRIENLYLAGSVLSREFDWRKIWTPDNSRWGGVHGLIRSDRAAADWPVGVLCRILECVSGIPYLGEKSSWQYLGSGGVRGFEHKSTASGHMFLAENCYLRGAHGEALHPRYHSEIAEFLLTGKPTKTRHPDRFQEAPDTKLLRRIFFGAIVGLALVAALFVLTAFLHTSTGWAVFVAFLATLLVIRGMMSV